mgnify:CR=1 FL=1
MNKDFDFDKVGKRMPYTIPDGFFDKLEDDIWKDVKNNNQEKHNSTTVTVETQRVGRKSTKLHLLMRSVITAAASIALLLVISMNFSKSNETSFNDVAQAFSQLTSDDQTYLLNIYQDDVFINE